MKYLEIRKQSTQKLSRTNTSPIVPSYLISAILVARFFSSAFFFAHILSLAHFALKRHYFSPFAIFPMLSVYVRIRHLEIWLQAIGGKHEIRDIFVRNCNDYAG